jgi:hypothetical protein
MKRFFLVTDAVLVFFLASAALFREQLWQLASDYFTQDM